MAIVDTDVRMDGRLASMLFHFSYPIRRITASCWPRLSLLAQGHCFGQLRIATRCYAVHCRHFIGNLITSIGVFQHPFLETSSESVGAGKGNITQSCVFYREGERKQDVPTRFGVHRKSAVR